MQILLTKEFSFQMAHALAKYPGKCRNLHGHNYKLFVTIASENIINDSPFSIHHSPLKNQDSTPEGMVMDFTDIKRMVEKILIEPFDHALVVPKGSPFESIEDTKLIVTDFEPTSENLLLYFASLLAPHIPEGVRLHSIKLYETDTSCAELIL